jgi:quercetin dioxygenase-like cupin family protein
MEFDRMKYNTLTALLLTVVSITACSPSPTDAQASVSASARESEHSLPPGVRWGPAPAIFPRGAQMAVLQGDPSGTALFTVRLRMPDGYVIPPHTHPTDEIVTVIDGTFRVGMGPTFDRKSMMTLGEGGFVVAPANHAHFAATRGRTIVQVHAMGPFAMTYVNPADTPKP